MHWSCVVAKESVMWGDVGKSVEESIRDEVRGVKNVRWNRVSPDTVLEDFNPISGSSLNRGKQSSMPLPCFSNKTPVIKTWPLCRHSHYTLCCRNSQVICPAHLEAPRPTKEGSL